MNYGIEYEKAILREVYQLLYPHSRVTIHVCLTNNNLPAPAKELTIEESQDLINRRPDHEILKIPNTHRNSHDKFFLVSYNSKTAQAPAAKNPHKKRTEHWKDSLKSRLETTGLLFEIIKDAIHRYQDRRAITHISNSPNPNQPQATLNSPTKNRIALIGMHWLDVGGAEKFAVEACNFANRIGYKTIVIAEHISRPFYREELQKFCKVIELDRQIAPSDRDRFILELLRQLNIDKVHIHHCSILYRLLPEITATQPKADVMDTLHIDERSRFGMGYPRLSIEWKDYINKHHVISHRLSRLLRNNHVPPEKIVFGHLGKQTEVTRSFNIRNNRPERKLRIAFVGRMGGQKRPLLAAICLRWAIRYSKRYNFHVTAEVVGDGHYLTSFKKIASPVKESFIFHDASANVEDILGRSDVLLLSSQNEGVTLVAFEAHRNGCLVVSSDVGAQEEVICEELLLREAPLLFFMQWKSLWKRILLMNEASLEQLLSNADNKMRSFLDLPNANSILTEFYE